jgi:hypothetical protein
MKQEKIGLSLVLLLAYSSCFLQAQGKYYNADRFPLLGKLSDDTETKYERLPAL